MHTVQPERAFEREEAQEPHLRGGREGRQDVGRAGEEEHPAADAGVERDCARRLQRCWRGRVIRVGQQRCPLVAAADAGGRGVGGVRARAEVVEGGVVDETAEAHGGHEAGVDAAEREGGVGRGKSVLK